MIDKEVIMVRKRNLDRFTTTTNTEKDSFNQLLKEFEIIDTTHQSTELPEWFISENLPNQKTAKSFTEQLHDLNNEDIEEQIDETLPKQAAEDHEEHIEEQIDENLPEQVAKIRAEKCDLTEEQQNIMQLDNDAITYIINKLQRNNQQVNADKIRVFFNALKTQREHDASSNANVFRDHTILHLTQKYDKHLGYDMREIFNIIVNNIERFPKKSDYLEVKCLCSTPGKLIAAAEKYDAKHKTQNRSSNRAQILYNLLEKSDQQEAPPTHVTPTNSNTPSSDSNTLSTESTASQQPPHKKRSLRNKSK